MWFNDGSCIYLQPLIKHHVWSYNIKTNLKDGPKSNVGHREKWFLKNYIILCHINIRWKIHKVYVQLKWKFLIYRNCIIFIFLKKAWLYIEYIILNNFHEHIKTFNKNVGLIIFLRTMGFSGWDFSIIIIMKLNIAYYWDLMFGLMLLI